jgi:hypothetical protein
MRVLLAFALLVASTTTPAHAQPETDDEAAYLDNMNGLLAYFVAVTSGSSDTAAQRKQIILQVASIKATWEQVPVPERYQPMNDAFEHFIGYWLASLELLDEADALDAPGQACDRHQTCWAAYRNALNRSNSASVASDTGLRDFVNAFYNEAGYVPGRTQ